MVDRILYLDCGNTRVKYAYDGQMGVFQSVAELEAKIQRLPKGQVVLASVSKISEEVAEACLRCEWALHHVQVTDGFGGLTLAYRDVSRLGVDRWLAMLGALALGTDRGVMVADFGTALTLDLVDCNRNHLGGLIAPGLQTSAKALNGNTANLPLAEFSEVSKLGFDTQSCINYGVIMSSVALIEHTMVKFGNHAELVLTGGDAPLVASQLGIRCTIEPELVFMGLRYYWQNL